MAVYTCFGFDNYDINTIHCTHKYLGKNLEETDVSDIIKIIDAYLQPGAPKAPCYFTSPNIDERGTIWLSQELHEYAALRLELRRYRKDDYTGYPHITGGEPYAKTLPNWFDSYNLVKDGIVIKEWSI